MESFNILLVDDHKMVLDSIKSILLEAKLCQRVDCASNATEARGLIKRLKYDTIVCDIHLGEESGLDLVEKVRAQQPVMKSIFITGNSDIQYFKRAIELGANGFLLKHSSAEELLRALETVRSGGSYVSVKISRELMENQSFSKSVVMEQNFRGLTEREKQIWELLSSGKKVREIAELFSISVKTVETHKANLMKKLGAKNIVDLVKKAVKNGVTGL